jgi:hypothetical protein
MTVFSIRYGRASMTFFCRFRYLVAGKTLLIYLGPKMGKPTAGKN